VAIVSAALAARHWPPGEAVGKRLRLPGTGSESPWLTVVGVAGDIHSWRVEDTSLPWVYVPLAQAAQSSMRLVVRSRGEAAALAAAIRAELARIDPNLAMMDLLPFDAAIRRSLWAERLFTYVFQVFGFVALALALVGLYGVISYAVAQRTTEIGIRAALGARRGSLVWLVLRDGARLTLAGVVIGTVAAYGATRALTGLLYGVTPHDASTFGAVAALVLAVCSLAAYIPARRAARMDPLRALREG